MPLTWNDLLITNPADTELVSVGASRIRQVVEAGKTATDLEHYQTGEHQFPTIQPGTPHDGQIWFDLVNKVIRRTNGTSHDIANAVGMTTAYTSTFQNITGGSYATRLDLSGVVVLPNSRVLLLGFVNGSALANLDLKWVRDVTDVGKTWSVATGSASVGVTTTVVDVDTPTAGTYTYHMFGKSTSAAVTSIFLIALVL